MMQNLDLRRDQVVQVAVTSVTHEGQGVARLEGMALFVRGAVPGDTAQVRLTRIKRSYAEGVAVRILAPSPDRVTPRCPHFGVCGGCASQDLAYTKQVEYKAQHIADSLVHIGGLTATTLPALRMDDPWNYRNKMEFAFGEKDGRLYLGLMKRGSYEDVEEISACYLATPRAMQAVRLVEGFMREQGLKAYNARERSGALRHLVVREGRRTGELMLNVVSTSAAKPQEGLVAAVAGVKPSTVLWTINDTWGAVVRPDSVHVLMGGGEIREQFGHLSLLVGPFSFLQTNSQMVELLYAEVERQAALTGTETVLDLYCGVGAIGLYLARRARQVAGIEAVFEAVAFARRNAESNGITDATFQCAEVEALSTLSLGAINPDVVIADPPRAGLHPRLLATLLGLGADRIVYVSCNAAALARDLKALAAVYSIGAVQPVDMFPHTWHVESVVTLTRTQAREA